MKLRRIVVCSALTACLTAAAGLGAPRAVHAEGSTPGTVATATAAAAAEAEKRDAERRRKDNARVIQEAERQEGLDTNSAGRLAGGEINPPSIGMLLLRTVLVLITICLLAYLLLGKLLPRMMAISPMARRSMLAAPSRGIIEVVDRLPLDPRRAVYVIKVGTSHYLVGVTDGGMTLLSRLDGDNLPPVPEAERNSWLGGLPNFLARSAGKEG